MSFKTSDEPGLYLLTLRCDGLQFVFSSKPRQNELSHFHMTSAVCLNMEGRGWVEGVWGSVHSGEACSQCLLFTDGLFTGPTSCPSLPPKLSSIPYRIPPSGASGMKGGCRGGCRGRGGSPPLMFSLGTGCCLFDFQ